MFEAPEQIEGILKALGCVGTWEIDYKADRIRNTGQLSPLYGLTPAQAADGVTLKATDRIFHPDDLDEVRRIRKSTVAIEGGRRVLQFRIVDADGCTRWLETHGHVIVDRYGAPIRGQGIAFDVTARRLAEMHVGSSPPLAGLDDLAANLLHAYQGARELGLSSVEVEVKPILMRVVHMLGRRLRSSILH